MPVRTKALVRIGQVWERRRPKALFRVYQVHRHGHGEVQLVPAGLEDPPKGSDITRVSCTDLGQKYRLQEEQE